MWSGPQNWPSSHTDRLVLTGIFSITSIAIIYAPEYGAWAQLRPSWVFPLSVSRIVFVAYFIILAYFGENQVLGNVWVQRISMLLFSVVHGYLFAMAFVYNIELATGNAKVKASKLVVIALTAGSTLSFIFSRYLVKGVPKSVATTRTHCSLDKNFWMETKCSS